MRDTARNTGRQLAIAWRVFDTARGYGWPAILSYGAQGNIALHKTQHKPLTNRTEVLTP